MKFTRSNMDTTSVNSEKNENSGANGTELIMTEGHSDTHTSSAQSSVNSERLSGLSTDTVASQSDDGASRVHNQRTSELHPSSANVGGREVGSSPQVPATNHQLTSTGSSQLGDGRALQNTQLGNGRTVRNSVDVDKAEEDEQADGEGLSSNLTFSQGSQRQRQNRPGVILLGRGNSFSLGRSEVILLHGNRPKRASSRSNSDSNKNNSVLESSSTASRNSIDNSTSDNILFLDTQHNTNSSQGNPTPPPISNGESPNVITNGVVSSPGGGFVADELEMLWRKAESIMAAKQRVVQQVLEEFGVGEVGGGGEEDERATEEENVWQVVQNNFQV